MPRVRLYDTTLRDGTQWEGISLSVEDKLKIAAKLDEFRSITSRAAGPGSNPKDIEFFAACRSWGCARPGRGFRQHPRARLASRGRLQHPHARRSRDASRGAGQQELGHARHRGAAHHARREPGDDPRLGGLSEAARPRSHLRCRALLRRLQRNREYATRRSARPPRPAPTCSSSATPMAAASPGRSRRSRGRSRRSAGSAGRPHPQRQRLRGRATRSRRSGGRRAGAGHDQRLRRALRQRRPVRRHPEPRAQDGRRRAWTARWSGD